MTSTTDHEQEDEELRQALEALRRQRDRIAKQANPPHEEMESFAKGMRRMVMRYPEALRRHGLEPDRMFQEMNQGLAEAEKARKRLQELQEELRHLDEITKNGDYVPSPEN